MKRLLPLLPLALLAACQTTPTRDEGPRTGGSTSFRAEDFAWSTAEGRNIVRGQVAYRSASKQAYTCAGGSVGLTPETAYSRQRISALYGSTSHAVVPLATLRSRQVAAAGGDYGRYVRTTTCDAQGRFSFTGLPDGGWYVIARARPTSGSGEEMAIVRRVEARGGASREAVL